MQERNGQPASGAKQKLKDWVFPVVGFVAALLAIYAFIDRLAPETVERPEAATYLHSFFDDAVRDPSKAFDEFDNTYRSHHESETRAQFVAHFGDIYDVKIGRVRAENDGFAATVTYCHRTGASKTREQWFKLVCSKCSELPLVGCGLDDISIHDTITNTKTVAHC